MLHVNGVMKTCAVQDKAMYETNNAVQCFDVACEEALTTMGFLTGICTLCLYHATESGVSVFRYGDVFVV